MSREIEFELSDLQRINLVGTSGCGKTTLGRKLAEILEAPHIEMDAFYHGPNWSTVDPDVFLERVTNAIAPPKWILDGNYHDRTHAIKWARATMVVWLDMPFLTNMFRAVSRAVNRAWTQEEFWPGSGNRESFRKSFFSTDSIILWTAKTYQRRRRDYLKFVGNPPGVRFIQLSGPKEVEEFLAQVERVVGDSGGDKG